MYVFLVTSHFAASGLRQNLQSPGCDEEKSRAEDLWRNFLRFVSSFP